jgi:hypothetical protein
MLFLVVISDICGGIVSCFFKTGWIAIHTDRPQTKSTGQKLSVNLENVDVTLPDTSEILDPGEMKSHTHFIYLLRGYLLWVRFPFSFLLRRSEIAEYECRHRHLCIYSFGPPSPAVTLSSM